MMRIVLCTTTVLLASILVPRFTSAQPLGDPIPTTIPKGTISIELAPVATGLTAPNFLTDAGDGTDRQFVVDQAGTIRLIENGSLVPEPFLDIADRLVPLGFFGTMDENDFDERGLLGLAFHPGFADPTSPGHGRLYTYSSEPVSGTADFSVPLPVGATFDHQSVVAEWQVDPLNPNRVDPTTRREVLRIDEPQFNHNAGALAFSPLDGYLYIAVGDGGGADDQAFDGSDTGHGPNGNGQNIETALGSILRIDPLDPMSNPASGDAMSANGRYRVPGSNPFVGQAGLDEIAAFGLRNPFRMSFDTSGDLIIGDVGQNDIEELDVLPAGQLGFNFGWRLKEGSFFFDPNGVGEGFVGNSPVNGVLIPPDLVDPVAEYDHDDGLSVIGGFVYRGSEIPELEGMFVFGDFSTEFSAPLGRLFYADLSTGIINEFILGADDRDLGLFVKGFGQDAEGELYVLAGTNLGPFGSAGQVLRIVAVPEPASRALALVAIALALVAALRKRLGTYEIVRHCHQLLAAGRYWRSRPRSLIPRSRVIGGRKAPFVFSTAIAASIWVAASSTSLAAPIDQAVFTSFEGIGATEFEIGEGSTVARFTGGFSAILGVTELYHSGQFAWMVSPQQMGTIEFETPAAVVEFYVRTRSLATANTIVTTFGEMGDVLDTLMVQPSDGFVLASLAGPITRIEVFNADPAHVNSIDDFGFTPVEVSEPTTMTLGLCLASVIVGWMCLVSARNPQPVGSRL